MRPGHGAHLPEKFRNGIRAAHVPSVLPRENPKNQRPGQVAPPAFRSCSTLFSRETTIDQRVQVKATYGQYCRAVCAIPSLRRPGAVSSIGQLTRKMALRPAVLRICCHRCRTSPGVASWKPVREKSGFALPAHIIQHVACRSHMYCFSSLKKPNWRVTFAGLPSTMESDGTSLVTTAPAPTTACSPMVTPPRMVACVPMLANCFTNVFG